MSDMSDKGLPIAIDAFGGDHAPEQIVEGASESGIDVILVGREDILAPLVKEHGNPDNLRIYHAPNRIGMDEHPLQAIRSKKDSSLMVAIRLVHDGLAAGVMSAGNTGAFTMGATLVLGRMPEVSRPAAAIPVPTPAGMTLLLDAGASTNCTAHDLLNFALMGDAYVRKIWNVHKPRIALLSIGQEETKGDKQARAAHKLLKDSNLNFIGNIEGSDLGTTAADVIVSDGFTGNVALKVAEGVAILVGEITKNELNRTQGIQKLASLALMPVLRKIKKRLDWQEYGGGALLGVMGNVVIAHGKSRKRAISSAIRLTSELARTDLLHEIEKSLSQYHELAQQAGA